MEDAAGAEVRLMWDIISGILDLVSFARDKKSRAPLPPLMVKGAALVALVVALVLAATVVTGRSSREPTGAALAGPRMAARGAPVDVVAAQPEPSLGTRIGAAVAVFVFGWVFIFLVVLVPLVILGSLTGHVGRAPVVERPVPSATSAPSARRKLLDRLDSKDLGAWGFVVNELGLCQRPFFDPGSEADQKLLLSAKPVVPLEVDTLEGLQRVLQPDLSPTNATVVYQNWGDAVVAPDGSSSRPYQWLSKARAEEVGRALKGGPVRAFCFVVTTVAPGALRAFADALGSGQLQYLGVCWYFSGDDVTDEEGHASDIGYAAAKLGVGRLSVLTAAFDGGCDERLAAALAGAPSLRRCQIFRKDDAHAWPVIASPRVAAALKGR